jgi:hypothetical protein
MGGGQGIVQQMPNDGKDFLKDVFFWSTDPVPGGTPAPPSGQGISMSSDEMRTMLATAKKTRDTIRERQQGSLRLSQAVPPANVQPSNDAVNGTNGVNETGRYYTGHTNYQYNYQTSLITKLEAALGMTVETDQQNADAAKKPLGEFE